jgi:hypothetical protein
MRQQRLRLDQLHRQQQQQHMCSVKCAQPTTCVLSYIVEHVEFVHNGVHLVMGHLLPINGGSPGRSRCCTSRMGRL